MSDTPWLSGVDESEWVAAAAGERQRAVLAARDSDDSRVGYRGARDRPRQRRAGLSDRSPANRMTIRAKMDLRDSTDGAHLEYEGWASVTDTPYEMYDFFGPYTEQVTGGAFTKTLAQVEPPLDVPLVLQHDSLRRIARTTNDTLALDEDATGLHVLAPSLDPGDADVSYIAPKLRSGLIDEMSFKFMITKGSWSPDWMEFHIEEVDIHRGDVAIVAYGANPNTVGGLRSRPDVDQMPECDARDLYVRLGKRLGSANRLSGPTGRELISVHETRPRVL